MGVRLLLTAIMRVTGAAMLCGLVFAFVPYRWLAAIHSRIGMGDLEYSVLTSYLARTLSALYGILGGLLLAMSMDVDRYRPLIVLFGWIAVTGGVGVTILDAVLHLPLFWTVLEGPLTILMGVMLVVLASRTAAKT